MNKLSNPDTDTGPATRQNMTCIMGHQLGMGQLTLKTSHLYRGDASYRSAKSCPVRASTAVLLTSSTHVAGFASSLIFGTPSMPCRHSRDATCDRRTWVGVDGCGHGTRNR